MTHGALRPAAGRSIRDVAARLRHSERGQSLTELALILPVLLLLTTVALDFGRIYLGYINVQNMARIAANYAANNPLAWDTAPDAAVQLRYRNQIIEDMGATNCTLPVSGGAPVIPTPTFVDANADGSTGGLGDLVRVQISCSFAVATPIIGGILGGSVAVTAESDFPVKAGMTAVIASGGGGGGGGGGGEVTAPPNASFIANNSVVSGTADWYRLSGPDVSVDFRDASGGGPASAWLWSFGDGTTSTDQDVVHTFHCTPPLGTDRCQYLVTMIAENAYGSSSTTMYVRVKLPADVQFSADRTIIDARTTVTFTDESTPGGTQYEWYFGTSTTPFATGPVVSYTFNTVGTYTVRHKVWYDDGTAPYLVKVDYITVNPGYCTVPSLTNVRFNDATSYWNGTTALHGVVYHFSGTVKRAAGAPNGNFTITAQSIAAGGGATALCTSDLYVSAP